MFFFCLYCWHLICSAFAVNNVTLSLLFCAIAFLFFSSHKTKQQTEKKTQNSSIYFSFRTINTKYSFAYCVYIVVVDCWLFIVVAVFFVVLSRFYLSLVDCLYCIVYRRRSYRNKKQQRELLLPSTDLYCCSSMHVLCFSISHNNFFLSRNFFVCVSLAKETLRILFAFPIVVGVVVILKTIMFVV